MREAPLDQKNPWFPGVFRPQRTLSPSLKEMFKQPSSPLYGQFHVHGPGSNARLIRSRKIEYKEGAIRFPCTLLWRFWTAKELVFA